MKTYEEMTQIVLHRIEEERLPRWKAILLTILKYAVILLILLISITLIFFVLNIIRPFTGFYLTE